MSEWLTEDDVDENEMLDKAVIPSNLEMFVFKIKLLFRSWRVKDE
jgi:hypothetical protein|tara:strand:- start:20357 stop:20491 length:135 start_codon:yes stop_codon:yes gene_type:complete